MSKEEFLSLIDKASSLLYQNYEEDGLKTYVQIIQQVKNAEMNGLADYLTKDSIVHLKASSVCYSHRDLIGLADEIVLIGATLHG